MWRKSENIAHSMGGIGLEQSAVIVETPKISWEYEYV